MENDKRLELAHRFSRDRRAERLASQIATRHLIVGDQLAPEEMLQLAAIYPTWQAGVGYKANDIVNYNDKLYIVIQPHTSQANWLPDAVPALYKSTVPAGLIPDWVQPTGAHDAYKIGDTVMFEGQTYKSLINGNTWSPTAYPAGWEKQ